MEKLKLKLSHNQAISLANIFMTIIGDDVPAPSEPSERLILAILAQLDKRLQKMLIDRKKKYSLTLNEVEMLAFYVFFTQVSIPVIVYRQYRFTVYR